MKKLKDAACKLANSAAAKHAEEELMNAGYYDDPIEYLRQVIEIYNKNPRISDPMIRRHWEWCDRHMTDAAREELTKTDPMAVFAALYNL